MTVESLPTKTWEASRSIARTMISAAFRAGMGFIEPFWWVCLVGVLTRNWS